MLKHSILLFLGFLAFTSAAFTPEKNFFFLPYNNGLANKIFQTRNGIIAYSVDLMQDNTYAPHYVEIDLDTSNVTEILKDLPTACGQGPSAFDRLHYHVLTYTFVYYCTNNNSILLLESQNYEVQKVISLNINETFDEVRLGTDGYSVAIVGLSGLFAESPGPSHLIIVNLQTQEIDNHVVFDHGLAAGEAVSAYDTNGINMYIITNIVNSTINIANVYQMNLIGNSYSLTHLTTFSSTGSFVYTLPEFYIIKNLIFTSSGENLVVVNVNGNIQGGQTGVALDVFPNSRTTHVYRPVIISFPGFGSLFVSLNNNTLLEITQEGQGYNVQNNGTYTSVSLAIQYQLTGNLLFYFGGENRDFLINRIRPPQTHYQSIANFTSFMITDKTYCVNQTDGRLFIFDIQTNELIKVIPLLVPTEGYYDQKSSSLSYLFFDEANHKYSLQQTDLRTGNTYVFFTLDFTSENVKLVHATNSENFDNPELVIHISGSSDEFVIISQTFGQVNLVLDNPSSAFTSTIAVDYDTLTAFYFLHTDNSQTISVTEYNYILSNDSFVSKNTNQNLVNGTIIPATDYSIITTSGNVAVINMSSLNETNYSFPTQWSSLSTFQNSTNGFSMVLSQAQQWGAEGNQQAGILYDNQIQALPGITSNTVQAGTAGTCSYWVVNQVGSFANVQFYNICDNDTVSEIIV